MLDGHAAKPAKQEPPKNQVNMSKATTDIWENMGLDIHLSEKVRAQRKATGAMMDSIEKKLEPHVEAASFPDWIVDHFKPLGINGLSIKDFGAPGMTCVE